MKFKYLLYILGFVVMVEANVGTSPHSKLISSYLCKCKKNKKKKEKKERQCAHFQTRILNTLRDWYLVFVICTDPSLPNSTFSIPRP